MTERATVDTSGYETPESLCELMGVFALPDGNLVRAGYQGTKAPEQTAFDLRAPIGFPTRDRWYNIDGDIVHAFWRSLWSHTRYLMPSNCELRGAASVFPWSDSLHQRAALAPTMCVNPSSTNMNEYGWVVVDVSNNNEQAHVFMGDWNHCLYEFINASHADLIKLVRKQMAEETSGLLPKMNKSVTVHRDHKLQKLDEEWRTQRKKLIEQWAAQQAQLIHAEEAQWQEENDATRVYGLVLGSNNDKTPLRTTAVKSVRGLMARHEREHGMIDATILWTVKETDVDGAGVWHKYATYDAERCVWTLLF